MKKIKSELKKLYIKHKGFPAPKGINHKALTTFLNDSGLSASKISELINEIDEWYWNVYSLRISQNK